MPPKCSIAISAVRLVTGRLVKGCSATEVRSDVLQIGGLADEEDAVARGHKRVSVRDDQGAATVHRGHQPMSCAEVAERTSDRQTPLQHGHLENLPGPEPDVHRPRGLDAHPVDHPSRDGVGGSYEVPQPLACVEFGGDLVGRHDALLHAEVHPGDTRRLPIDEVGRGGGDEHASRVQPAASQGEATAGVALDERGIGADRANPGLGGGGGIDDHHRPPRRQPRGDRGPQAPHTR